MIAGAALDYETNPFLDVTVEVVERRKASLIFYQEVRSRDGNQLFCNGKVRVACLDAVRLRPRPPPEKLLMEVLHGR